ncbi:amidohydrolase [Rhodococcus sp. NPDC055024]
MTNVVDRIGDVSASLVDLYKDLHAHPELSFAEHRTAGIVADRLRDLGFEVHSGVGGTGVVGVLRNSSSLRKSSSATVLLRADMDALPVEEATGLEYASTKRGTDKEGNDVPIMHACGHDMHVVALLGAARILSETVDSWSGTLEVVFQPAEELGAGAQAMVDDGLYELVPKPDVVLGQHVAPAPAGIVGLHSGAAFAAADSMLVRMFGRGGHGSRPETTIDPIVMAASAVMRLQTVVSREIAGSDTGVLTVGQFHAGTKNNIIADHAEFGLSIRTVNPEVRNRVLDAVHRIVRAEAQASGAVREPELIAQESFPVLINDGAACDRVSAAFRGVFGEHGVIDPGPVTGSEDVGILADAAGAPLVYWLLGGADPEAYLKAATAGTVGEDIASNHSPRYAPVIQPTLDNGITALTTAALEWLS